MNISCKLMNFIICGVVYIPLENNNQNPLGSIFQSSKKQPIITEDTC